MTWFSLFLATGPAHGFCGFYVSGADSSLYNDATMVVLLRDGTRTVLSMQNSYQGPPEDFALVVPVPEVLQKEDVKTLPAEVFDRIDQLSAKDEVQALRHGSASLGSGRVTGALDHREPAGFAVAGQAFGPVAGAGMGP